MKTIKYILIILTFFSCRQNQNVSNMSKNSVSADTLISLTNSIKLVASSKDDLGLRNIKILNELNEIFKDSTNGYILSENSPIIINCENNTTQILLEFDNRPNFNKFKLITIKNNRVHEINDIPLFEWAPIDIDNDGLKEVAGYLTNGETITQNDSAFYNPLLVYKITKNGLVLDTINTQNKNISIWGKFYGYKYNDTLLLKYNPDNK